MKSPKAGLASFETIEVIIDEGSAKLSSSVGAKIHKDDDIVVINSRRDRASFPYQGSLHKFIAFFSGIGSIQRCIDIVIAKFCLGLGH
jgi:predicted P-loop ATPase/GTPase